MNFTWLTIVLGATLTVGAVLVTMIWTLREMYAHEARFADANLFAAVSSAAAVRRPAERRSRLVLAQEWYRVSNEFMAVSARHSEIARLLFISEILVAGALLTIAAAGDVTWAAVGGLSLIVIAAVLFVLGAAATYDLLGAFYVSAAQPAYRKVSRLFAGLLPFLATPWPEHWPEIEHLMKNIPELRAFAEDPFNTVPLAAELATALQGRSSRERTTAEPDKPRPID